MYSSSSNQEDINVNSVDWLITIIINMNDLKTWFVRSFLFMFSQKAFCLFK